MSRRVIVIGLDGLEPTIVESLIAAGELPNLARLAAGNGLARVATTAPPQTPVAWSTFATGVNPGGHGIFDFLRRDPMTYLPDSGLNHYEQKSPLLPPKAVNQRRGAPLWERLSARGIPSVVLRCPCTYPPDRLRGSMLSGMGVPDLRGGFGTSSFYTGEPSTTAGEGENVIHVQVEGGRATTHLIGPRQPRTRADAQFEITLELDPGTGRVVVRSAGSPNELEVKLGRWSAWLRVKFKIGPLQSAHGLVRFHLVRLEPTLELYASPVNFDPSSPLFPISAPHEFAADLAGSIGLYHTTGMVEDHNGLVNERISEDAFLAQCEDAWREREAMMAHELEYFQEGLFYCLFDTPDRVQHMLWRFREPGHPANAGRPPRPDLARAIEDHYRRADGVVGRVLPFVDDQTLFIVLSDHGFSSFQRGFHINTWLLNQGLLALKPGTSPGHDAGDFLRGVDWERTRAYALGLSGLYLNVRGREAHGTVAADEAPALRASIAAELGGIADAGRGTTAIRSAFPREAVYAGPFVDEAPDVIVNYAPGYRVSWSSSLGGVADGEPFEDNTRKWSGDHIIDPALVPGVLFMNQAFGVDRPRLLDLAPTILHALKVEKPAVMEGDTLLS